jgi:hypothetical protein
LSVTQRQLFIEEYSPYFVTSNFPARTSYEEQ